MSDKEKANEVCPYCGASAEIGFLKESGASSYSGLQWFEGEPSFFKSLFPIGESLGSPELLKGNNLKGLRCTKCRKIILNY